MTPKSENTSRFHRRKLAALLAVTVLASTGCSSMSASKGWWSNTGSSMYGATSTAAKGIGGQFKSIGTTVSGAYGKAKTAVVSTFNPKASASASSDVTKDDPTSLASMPSNLSPDLWVMQGQLAESQGQYDKALESYTKAINAQPGNVGALVSTARLYDRRGDNAHAVEYFQKALAVTPNDASVHNDLGLAYSKSGNPAAAKESLMKAASMDPSNVRYRNNLATLLVENGKAEEAVAQLQQVLPPAVAHYNVAYLHFSKQNIPAAQQQLQLALQADPNMKEARALYDRLNGSQVVAQASSAYQMAGNLYQTAQGFTQPATNAVPVSSQAPATGATTPGWVSTPPLTPGSFPAN